ncbi:gene transfer agent family protein [Paracoccus litorisediminis]|uniref:Gene transfer agent family protein n=1 Tax=Paracoccus litorisediminis TaxID=2006130 RepID=A0A844HT96_9RHOB|nr:gene transfer agent family protein [Paracoccus litorisediminis]MTH61445.1 gene transfer agent family protein [Paracoccus litorisediminis]
MQPVTIRWPGGEHDFRLGIAELEVIQQKTDCGPEYLLMKISAGRWSHVDLIEVIRNGLIGGGMAAAEALSTVRNAFELHPMIRFKVPATAILSACLYGPPDDPVGEDMPVEPTPGSETTASGNSAPITG